MNAASSPGANGRSDSNLRAVLALSLLVPVPTVGVLASMWLLPGPIGQTLYFVGKIWLVVLPAAWHFGVDRGRLRVKAPEARSVGVGLALGLAIGGVILGAYELLGSALVDRGQFRATAAINGLNSPLRYLAVAVYLCTVNALAEEYVWRWFVFRKCDVLFPGYPAVLLSALFFTVHHVFALAAQVPWPATVLGSIGVFVGGALWSWCYLTYRSVWPGYASHVVADVAILWIGWRLLFE